MIRTALFVLVAMFSITFTLHAQTTSTPTPDFAPGQEWSIKSSFPTTAKVVIGRVETFGNKVCVSISVIDVPIPQGAPGAGGATQIAHMPFDEVALAASVDSLVATGVPPSSQFESGYKQWQDAKGGVFTISVEKAIQIVFETIYRRQG